MYAVFLSPGEGATAPYSLHVMYFIGHFFLDSIFIREESMKLGSECGRCFSARSGISQSLHQGVWRAGAYLVLTIILPPCKLQGLIFGELFTVHNRYFHIKCQIWVRSGSGRPALCTVTIPKRSYTHSPDLTPIPHLKGEL